MTSEAQIALILAWAKDIGHSVDTTKSPKAEFARLAKAKGWVGGDETWCSRWRECFSEEYAYGQHSRSEETGALEDGGISLESSMCRLSIASDTLSFSVISRGSRANSFDSVRSFNSDESRQEQSATEVVPHVHVNSTLSLKTAELKEVTAMVSELSLNDSNVKTGCNPAWSAFTNFVHSPTAQFKSEFTRLARTQGWGKKKKKEQFVSLLSSEVAFYWGADEDKLEQYQKMCLNLGLTPVPATITQCKKALEGVKVNLFSMIDNARNPKIKIVQYKTLSKLRKSIRKSRCFPRVAAKAGGRCFGALLRKL